MNWTYEEGDLDEYEDYQLVHVKTEYDEDLSNYVCDFTFCHVTEVNGSTVLKTFSITGAGWDHTWVDATVTYSEQTVGGGGGGQLVVTITKSGNTYTSNKTITEILSAISSGQEVIVKYNDEIHCLCEYYNNNYQKEAHFSLVYWNNYHTYHRLFVIRDSSGNTVTTCSTNRIDQDPPEQYVFQLYCDDSPEYSDTPSGVFSVDTLASPASMCLYDLAYSLRGGYSGVLAVATLCYGDCDPGTITYPYIESYRLVSAEMALDQESQYVCTLKFETISFHTGSPILKVVTVSGLAYEDFWDTAKTVTYSATSL